MLNCSAQTRNLAARGRDGENRERQRERGRGDVPGADGGMGQTF